MYKSIKALLTHTTSCGELNGSLRSEWFENICGVRQGDCLSPTLFSLYINDLAVHLKDYGPTIDLNGVHIIPCYTQMILLCSGNGGSVTKLT